MTIEDALRPLSKAVAFYVRWRCRLTGHNYEPYTTIHLGDSFRQSFICRKRKQTRIDSRKKGRVSGR